MEQKSKQDLLNGVSQQVDTYLKEGTLQEHLDVLRLEAVEKGLTVNDVDQIVSQKQQRMILRQKVIIAVKDGSFKTRKEALRQEAVKCGMTDADWAYMVSDVEMNTVNETTTTINSHKGTIVLFYVICLLPAVFNCFVGDGSIVMKIFWLFVDALVVSGIIALLINKKIWPFA